jgi:glycosyltransferase involved in cell wall biosynthesis
MTEPCVALLGRRDEPTDAIEEYCRYLAEALEPRGFALELIRVPWSELGWRAALKQLEEQARAWRGRWVFVQYTALGWSRRGFPLAVLRILKRLEKNGVRCAIVFHDAGPYYGQRLVDRVRRAIQLRVMRKALQLAELAVLTIPAENMPWLPSSGHRSVFIPVGANLPAPEAAWTGRREGTGVPPAVAIFSVTGGSYEQKEVEYIVETARHAAERTGAFRLVVFGRNAEHAGPMIQEGLRGTSVEVVIHGLLSAEEVVRQLGECSVSLFLRGGISTRRGSAIAGIACGLPVIACEDAETGGPILEAGLVLLPPGAYNEFGPALARVLSDAAYRGKLATRSRRAQEQFFSWPAIAARYAEVLEKSRPSR